MYFDNEHVWLRNALVVLNYLFKLNFPLHAFKRLRISNSTAEASSDSQEY